MRIITGTAKGFKLKAPRGLDVRPTGDRVKESIFNIISRDIWDADVLDLFAGTGNLGLEALSRGARSAVFVDSALTSLSVLKENAVHTRLAERAEFIKADAIRAIDRFYDSGRNFNIIFCDPPYNKGYTEAILSRLEDRPILRVDGILVIEHSKHEVFNQLRRSLKVIRTESYGETNVTFFITTTNAYTKEDS